MFPGPSIVRQIIPFALKPNTTPFTRFLQMFVHVGPQVSQSVILVFLLSHCTYSFCVRVIKGGWLFWFRMGKKHV